MIFRPSYLLSCATATKTISFANKNASYALGPCAEGVSFRCSTQFTPAQGGSKSASGWRGIDAPLRGKVFYSSTSDRSQGDYTQDDDMPPQRTYADVNLDARMRMKAYRREALQQRHAAEMEEDANRYDLDPAKLLKKGDPDTVQAIVKEVIQVGFFVDLPSGKEGFLPARELGTTGGVALLEKLFKVGQEITVRSVRIGGYGRDVVAIKKDTPVDLPGRPYIPPRGPPGENLPYRNRRR